MDHEPGNYPALVTLDDGESSRTYTLFLIILPADTLDCTEIDSSPDCPEPACSCDPGSINLCNNCTGPIECSCELGSSNPCDNCTGPEIPCSCEPGSINPCDYCSEPATCPDDDNPDCSPNEPSVIVGPPVIVNDKVQLNCTGFYISVDDLGDDLEMIENTCRIAKMYGEQLEEREI